MKWIEGVRARTTIADLTEKANEQHYEVCLQPRFFQKMTLLKGATPLGLDEVHPVDSGSIRKVFFVPLSDREGDAGGGGDSHAGELLREGAAQGWLGHLGFRMW